MSVEDARRKSNKAIALLETLRAAPTPTAYSVAYRMVEEPMGELARAFEAHLRSGNALDEATWSRLGQVHIEAPRGRAIGVASAELGDQLMAILSLVTDAGNASGEFGQLVSRAGDALVASKDEATLSAVVSGLVERTRRMEERQAQLTQALREKERQVASINTMYVEAMNEARRDALTGLPNRKHFDEAIYAETLRCDEGQGPLSLLMVDIDHFKRINDGHGHPVGDMVIRLVGDIVRECGGGGRSLPARLGGEEFALLLPGKDEAEALSVAEAVRRRVEGARFSQPGLQAEVRGVTVSVGVARHNPGDAPDVLVARADACLYGAKEAGRNRLFSETDGPSRRDLRAA